MVDLWIPGAAAEKGERVLGCVTCGKEYPEEHRAKYIRHCVQCSQSVEDEIDSYIRHREANVFSGEPDTDKKEWKSKRRAEGKPAANGRGGMA